MEQIHTDNTKVNINLIRENEQLKAKVSKLEIESVIYKKVFDAVNDKDPDWLFEFMDTV